MSELRERIEKLANQILDGEANTTQTQARRAIQLATWVLALLDRGERPEPVAWASPESLAFFATYRGNEAKTAVCSDRTEYDSVPLYASPVGRTPGGTDG